MVRVICGDRVFSGIRAVIFDKDGTLADSQHYLWQQAYKRIELLEARIGEIAPVSLADRLLRAWGIEDDRIHPAGLMAVGSRRDNEIVTAGYLTALELGWVEALTLVSEVFAQASQAFPNKVQLTPMIAGVPDCLESLHRSGLRLGMLSADTTANVEAFAATHGLDVYCDLLMGAQPGLSKPDPQLLQMACDALGVLPSETLVVGDSDADIELAKRSGAAGAIGVAWGWEVPLRLPRADVMISHLDQLQILEQDP